MLGVCHSELWQRERTKHLSCLSYITVPRGNERIVEGKFLFIGLFHLLNEERMIELEYHNLWPLRKHILKVIINIWDNQTCAFWLTLTTAPVKYSHQNTSQTLIWPSFSLNRRHTKHWNEKSKWHLGDVISKVYTSNSAGQKTCPLLKKFYSKKQGR